jgi:hypothetical protein
MQRAAIVVLALLGGALFGAPAFVSIVLAQDYRINDVTSARKADTARLTPGAIEFSDQTSAAGLNSDTALVPFDEWASRHPIEKKFLALFPSYVEPVVNGENGQTESARKPYTEKLYMYVAQARFILAKSPTAIDLAHYVTLAFLQKVDPAIQHKTIAANDVTTFKDKAGTGNDNPDRKWCTGIANLVCIQSTYKLEGKIPIGIMLVNKLRDTKKVADHIDFQSELAALAPSDLDQNGLQELTGLPIAVSGFSGASVECRKDCRDRIHGAGDQSQRTRREAWIREGAGSAQPRAGSSPHGPIIV